MTSNEKPAIAPFFPTDRYRLVASNYDSFYQARNETLMNALLKYFDDVQPKHVVADIGSGTGFFAERLFEERHLTNAIWCVDPSPGMQAVAKKRKGVYPITKRVEEFLHDFKIEKFFDKALCICCIHHFAELLEIFRGLEASLRPGGTLLVVTTGKSSNLPLFTNAEKSLGASTSNFKERITAMLRKANFEVEVSEEKIYGGLKKSRWYEMLRGRFQSTLSEFTDEEIEDGINELETGKLKGLCLEDEVKLHYSYDILKATKRY